MKSINRNVARALILSMFWLGLPVRGIHEAAKGTAA